MNIVIIILFLIYLLFILLTKRSIEILYSVKGKRYNQCQHMNKTYLYSLTPILNIIVFAIIWINNPYKLK